MNQSKFDNLYNRILKGETHNISFTDACAFVEQLGFSQAKQNGTSHRIFKMKGIPDIVNLQNDGGDAKPYQIAQIRKLINKYRLGGKDDE